MIAVFLLGSDDGCGDASRNDGHRRHHHPHHPSSVGRGQCLVAPCRIIGVFMVVFAAAKFRVAERETRGLSLHDIKDFGLTELLANQDPSVILPHRFLLLKIFILF